MTRTGHVADLTGVTATYSVVDLRYGEESSNRVVSSGNATLDTTSATTTAAAGEQTADPRLVQVASTSGFQAGRDYRITALVGDDPPETIHVLSVDSGVTPSLKLQAPLRRSYAAGATVSGVELSADFSATVADDETRLHNGAGPFLIIWDYTVNGVQHVVPQQIWLTRYSVVPPISEADLLLAFPALADRSRGRYSPNAAIAFATDETISDLGDRRIDADYHLDPSFKSAVRWHSASTLAMWLGEEDLADKWYGRYERKLRAMTTTLGATGTVDINRDENTAPAGDSKTRRGFFARS